MQGSNFTTVAQKKPSNNNPFVSSSSWSSDANVKISNLILSNPSQLVKRWWHIKYITNSYTIYFTWKSNYNYYSICKWLMLPMLVKPPKLLYAFPASVPGRWRFKSDTSWQNSARSEESEQKHTQNNTQIYKPSFFVQGCLTEFLFFLRWIVSNRNKNYFFQQQKNASKGHQICLVSKESR